MRCFSGGAGVLYLLSSRGTLALTLPVIDVEDGEALGKALREVGAAVIRGHGINLEGLLNETFFDGELPPYVDGKGWIPRGGESGGTGLREAKESFAFGKSSEFPVLAAAYENFCGLAHRVINALDEPTLTGCCETDASLARLFHYFPDDSLSVGSAPHTDWGLLTFVVADGPLDLFHQNQWHTINATGIILHAGDYMAMTVPGITSPRHRVNLLPDRHRFSLVFFYYPDSHASIPPTAAELRNDLSVLQCQAADPGVCSSSPFPTTFGDLIAKKWAEVRR